MSKPCIPYPASSILAALLSACMLVGGTVAQEKPPPQSASHKPISQDAVGPIQYVGPDTYLLLDREGRPQPVLGMKYEDFLAAWKQSQRLDAPAHQRRYAIEDVQINGTTKDGQAELKLDISIRLLTDEPVVVPLGMAGAILQSPPQTDERILNAGAAENREAPRGQSYLDYDPRQGGFVAGLDGRSDEVRKLSLDMLVPIVREGDATTLRLNFPRAVASRMLLSVAGPVGDVSLTGGSLISKADAGDSQTQLTLAGLRGDFQLTWKAAGTRRAELATVLSASGAILVSIDGRSIRSNAKLSVQSYGGGFDRFRVRLPPGAKLIQDQPAPEGEIEAARPDYQLTVEEDPPTAENAIGRQVVLVELARRQQGPVDVELATEQPLGLGGVDRELELAGFEVVGAVRQFGDVGLVVADDWQLRWNGGRYVRQVDPSALAPGLQQQPLTAAFQYDRQPWLLPARLESRPLRIHVTPSYEMDCLPDEARLQMRLAYSMPGARAFEFRVDMQGWELAADPIDSGGVCDRDRTVLTRDGQLILPLVQTSTRRADVTIFARRPIVAGADRIQFPLPIPTADTTAAAELTVLVAPGIELSPDTTASTGLIPTPVTERGPSPIDEQGRQVYRYRSYLPQVVFAAGRTVRPREISTEAVARLEVTAGQCRVEQQFNYTARYQPIKQLQFELPTDWTLDDAQVQAVLVDSAGSNKAAATHETPLSFSLSTEQSDGQTGSPRQAVVTLPQPRMDQFRIRLRYAVPLPAELSNKSTCRVPLVWPNDGQSTGQRLVVSAPRELSVAAGESAEGQAWQLATSQAQVGGGDAHEFVASERALGFPLEIGPVDPLVPQDTTVERVWLQTWLAGNVRQDRAAFRFRSAGNVAAVELPPDVSPREVEVVLDGNLADVLSRDEGRLVVRLDDAPAAQNSIARTRTLELRYRQPDQSTWSDRRRLTPPQLIGTTAWSEVYWQVVLPGDIHVVRAPAALASVGTWQWLGNFWGRRPALDQDDLEKWTGASAQLAPSAAQNEYLFSGLAPVASIELVTMPRWMIVLLASGAVLALVMLWTYVPLVRRRWLVAALAIAVACLSVAFPEPALLLGQASVLGLVLVIVAALLRRLTMQPARWPQPSTAGGSSVHSPLARSDSFVAPPTPASTSPTVRARLSDSHR